MKVQEQVSADVKNAMKAHDKFKTVVLRMVLAELKNARVEGTSQRDLSEDEEIAVVSRYYKKLEKSLPDYKGMEKQQEIVKEMEIVAHYLPKKASQQEIEVYVDQLVAESDDKNFGKLMKATMDHFGATADGRQVSAILKQKIGA